MPNLLIDTNHLLEYNHSVMVGEAQTLTHKKLLMLWLPLAVMWIVMAVEQPLITSIIARLSDPTRELAAFGYAFAIALLIEGPVVQILSAGTAISHSYRSYKAIIGLMHILAIGCTAIHLLLSIPAVFTFVALRILSLPEQLISPAYYSFLAMIPWAAAIGYRRLWQGVMIRYGKSKQVPIVMYLRILSAVIVLALGLMIKTIPGAVLGGLTLTVGVITGAATAWFFARKIVSEQMPRKEHAGSETRTRDVVSFYTPLAITSLITLGIRPLLNLGISLGSLPVESLALWPVVLAYMFIYTSISQSLQEIVIAQYDQGKNTSILRSFVLKVAVVLTLGYLLIYITPLKQVWFLTISGVPESTTYLLAPVLAIMALLPAAAAVVSLYRGILVSERKTKAITTGVTVNLITLVIIILVGVQIPDMPGIYSAAIAYITAFIFEIIYLALRARRLNSTLSS
jgi:hypothetical protein